jgi:hypothetical protein
MFGVFKNLILFVEDFRAYLSLSSFFAKHWGYKIQ